MKKCYKCQKPYVEPNGPGFQEVCEGCGSYLHCCSNCYFHDQYQANQCTEPQAEFVSDRNGMNRCEYFRFRVAGGGKQLDDDRQGRRFRKPDWRNLNKDANKPATPRRRATPDARPSNNPFARGGGGGGGDKAQKAREALEKLFKKE